MNISQTNKNKVAISLAIIVLIIGFYLLRQTPFNLNSIQSNASLILDFVKANPVIGTGFFITFYFFINAIPMPLVSLPTILAGYLFGTVNALIIVSFSGALGASCLFLMSRYLLKGWIKTIINKHSPRLNKISVNASFWNAVSLRLLPGMPFFIPSIALSFTDISLRSFYLSTQLGLLFIMFVFVNAGNQLLSIQSMDDIFNIELIVSMLLLALAPLLPNLVLRKIQRN